MCTIVGWNKNIPTEKAQYILSQAKSRGRDGYGLEADGDIFKSVDINTPFDTSIYNAKKVVGNFRATPTTEAVTKEEYLQPYCGIVHNGVIANDKDFFDFPVDSMVLPLVFKDITEDSTVEEFKEAVEKIKGSYALAFFRGDTLFAACNYKPIYYYWDDEGVVFASEGYMIPYPSVAMPAYSCAVIRGGKITFAELQRKQSNKAIVSCSGGLDSTTVAYILKEQGFDVTLAHFLYGCLAEKREVERIKQIAEYGGFNYVLIPMPNVMGGSIVEGYYNTENNGIKGAEYAEDWVSARNLLMLSILTAYAETHGFGYIAFGGNLEESGAYPDNEEEFAIRFNSLLPYAVQNGIKIELLHPVSRMMKYEIVKEGLRLNVPYELTWSCYGDGEKHCGICAPCYMRRTAFERNGVNDPVMSR